MDEKYSSYHNGLKVGDLIEYEDKKKLYLNYSLSKDTNRIDHGIVLNKEFLFENFTQWGNRKFFLYLKTQNIKILKRTGAL